MDVLAVRHGFRRCGLEVGGTPGSQFGESEVVGSNPGSILQCAVSLKFGGRFGSESLLVIF